MKRLALSLLLFSAACSSTPDSPVSSATPGTVRFSSEGTGKPDTAKHRPSRRHLPTTSRSLRRPKLENRHHAPQPAPQHDWTAVAACESSGDWHITDPPYSGGLQFTDSTWAAFGGLRYAATAALASRAQQIDVAERVLAAQGPGAWPICSQGVLR